jgi:hypothetical protein
MTTHTNSTAQMTSWNEEPFEEHDAGTKLTRAKVTQAFTGGVEGEGLTEWLMFYRADGTADFVGFLRVAGKLDGREGSFVLENRGTFDGKAAAGPLTIVPGSGSGELAGLRGGGEFSAPMGHEAEFTLDYELA